MRNAYPVDSGSRILMRLTCFFGYQLPSRLGGVPFKAF